MRCEGGRNRLRAAVSSAASRLVITQYFHYSGTMDIKTAVKSLAALAQEHRLAAYRELVQAGPPGIAAGELAGRLGIPANTLSFHAKALSHAGLVESRQAGRHVYYSASFNAMNALLDYLSDNCCGGRPCRPAAAPAPKRRTS